ncbi:hypothetical protein SCLCIDRAFT_1220745 [Scleroderma citrinum Foug A]|uniref:Uncharacterized protein n=1 Tax=Scleroderma citrinum Foug A TaxID=1036808 RepID=A0A0C3DHS9_9AGAM|nr:hypothetical protein SCLCIDRAFT_1220745 [Scleroderma citrinum Foug A]
MCSARNSFSLSQVGTPQAANLPTPQEWRHLARSNKIFVGARQLRQSVPDTTAPCTHSRRVTAHCGKYP